MATFLWPYAIGWPPPANILLAYDVESPDHPGAPAKLPDETSRIVDALHELRPHHGDAIMATGDKQANSYGWGSKLPEPVPDGSDATVPAPGFDVQYTDVRYAEATIEGVSGVFRTGEGKVDIAFTPGDGDAYSAVVTNHTGQEWAQGSGIYVFCPHLLAEGHNEYDLKGQVWDLQKRVSALEATVEGEYVDALETGAEDDHTDPHEDE